MSYTLYLGDDFTHQIYNEAINNDSLILDSLISAYSITCFNPLLIDLGSSTLISFIEDFLTLLQTKISLIQF